MISLRTTSPLPSLLYPVTKHWCCYQVVGAPAGMGWLTAGCCSPAAACRSGSSGCHPRAIWIHDHVTWFFFFKKVQYFPFLWELSKFSLRKRRHFSCLLLRKTTAFIMIDKLQAKWLYSKWISHIIVVNVFILLIYQHFMTIQLQIFAFICVQGATSRSCQH